MAEDWKKIKDKIGAEAQGPTPGDWEAMQAKINAQPALAPTSSKAWFSWLIAAGIGMAFGLTVMYLWPSATGVQGPETTVTNPIAEDQVLEKDLQQSESTGVYGQKASNEVQQEDKFEKPQTNPNANNRSSIQPELVKQALSSTSRSDGTMEETSTVVGTSGDVSSSNETDAVASDSEPSKLEEPKVKFEAEQPVSVQSEASALDSSSEKVKTVRDETEEDRLASRENEKLVDIQSNQIPASAAIPLGDSLNEKADDVAPNAITEEAQAEEAKPFLAASIGFELNRANFIFGFNHDFKSPATFAYGLGFELQWQKKRQFFSAGLSYYRIEQGLNRSSILNRSRIDSTWKQEVENREVTEVRRIWVIDSFQAGRYVYDTIVRTVVDTSLILRIDTNQYQTKFVNQVVRPYYYAELPLIYGYQLGRGPWQFQMAGGLALQQAIAYSNDEVGSKSLFGMTALIQPAMAWRFSDQWSALARVQLRYPLIQDAALYEEPALRYSFQLGVSFRW